MKIIQFKKGSFCRFGKLEGNYVIPFLSGNNPYENDLSDKCLEKNIQYNLSDIKLLVPVYPSKVIGVALNYPGVTENNNAKEPLIFIKGSNALVNSGTLVSLPEGLGTWGEAELAVVIKKEARNISISDAPDYILGYCVANDVTCHNTEERDHHLARSKSQDGFCPIGTFIDTDYDPEDKEIAAYQNGELIRKGNTSNMIFKIDQILVYLSSFMTLLPGDIILTGAPPRVRDKIYLTQDDIYTVSIEGLEKIETKFI